MSGWQALHAEVQLWQDAGKRLPLWWRDDDAIAPTAELNRLTDTARAVGLPVHLAVIPARAELDLPEFVAGQAHWLKPVIHGWAHVNHAGFKAKKAEFGRDNADAAGDAARALAQLKVLFGAAALPVFVPPWNRVALAVVHHLHACGYQIISTYGPRPKRSAAPGLVQINTHIDPVDWHGTRGLKDPGTLLGRLTAHLQDRRHGRADSAEPLGLLTHHLMQDDATWAFCEMLIDALLPISDAVADITAEQR